MTGNMAIVTQQVYGLRAERGLRATDWITQNVLQEEGEK
jgi:hypothetical protein